MCVVRSTIQQYGVDLCNTKFFQYEGSTGSPCVISEQDRDCNHCEMRHERCRISSPVELSLEVGVRVCYRESAGVKWEQAAPQVPPARTLPPFITEIDAQAGIELGLSARARGGDRPVGFKCQWVAFELDEYMQVSNHPSTKHTS
jgi:hypothetical protein